MPEIGQAVIWHDNRGRAHNALVTAVWGPRCINILWVSSDESRKDDCGRQFERQTSAPHKSQNDVHGFYWRFPDEEANPYKPPVAV